MSRLALRQLIARQQEARALVVRMAEALGTPLAIEDFEGGLLHGQTPAGPYTRHPVAIDGTRLGWVSGTEHAAAIAALLEHLVSRDSERKALGAEVLHLYQELNLIYNFSERLAALLDLQAVATLTLQQARQLIVATDGALLVVFSGSSSRAGNSMPRSRTHTPAGRSAPRRTESGGPAPGNNGSTGLTVRLKGRPVT